MRRAESVGVTFSLRKPRVDAERLASFYEKRIENRYLKDPLFYVNVQLIDNYFKLKLILF